MKHSAINRRISIIAVSWCIVVLVAVSACAGRPNQVPVADGATSTGTATTLSEPTRPADSGAATTPPEPEPARTESAPIPPAATSSAITGAAPAANPNEWNQLGHDPQRTSYVPLEIPGPWQFKWIWNGPVGGGDAGPAANHLQLPKGVQPIAGDGRLYVGHSDGTVRAIAEANGAQVWAVSIGGQVLNTGAYDADTRSVYFGSNNGTLARISANGQIERTFSAGGQIVMAPLLVGDTVYIGSANGNLYALDKTSLQQRWVYGAGAELLASPAYSGNHGGLIVVASEDKFVHAVRAANGSRAWRVAIHADEDPVRDFTSFADTYPVVSDANDVVIVRSYFDWQETWTPAGGAPATVAEIRQLLSANPHLQSFFVLELSNGQPRFVAPVMGGAIGNNDDYYSTPPQAVIKRLPNGSEVAYVLWRTRQSCLGSVCDGREDTTLGEMNLSTGNIRFVQDHKSAGSMRFPTDEQSPLSMAGNTLLHAHWMTLGAIQITDRSSNLGTSYDDPIRSEELTPVLNTLAAGTCPSRGSARHYCPQGMTAPGDGYLNDPGFYQYYYNDRVYDMFWTPPVRNAIISGGVIYWKSVDGAIIALQTGASVPPPPTPMPTPIPTLTGLDEHNYMPSILRDGS